MREEGGIKTRLNIYPGLPHGFWVVSPKASFSKKMRQDSGQRTEVVAGTSEIEFSQFHKVYITADGTLLNYL
jgi:hypothetical protein